MRSQLLVEQSLVVDTAPIGTPAVKTSCHLECLSSPPIQKHQQFEAKTQLSEPCISPIAQPERPYPYTTTSSAPQLQSAPPSPYAPAPELLSNCEAIFRLV